MRALVGGVPPLLIGAVAALLIVGTDGMDPTNVGWNSEGDAATHYLGWRFFRSSPWGFPIGSNPDYGLAIGSSIFYSDSIPLLAFAFKPFSHWLPEAFQYLGLWTAACLVLQAWFAWKLLGSIEETRGPWVRALATGLFVFSPPLMIRINGHSALVAHWMILAALYLYLKSDAESGAWRWPLLMLVATLVHSYLFVMVLALWVAAMAKRVWFGQRQGLLALVAHAATVLGVSLLGLWQAGFFMVSVAPAGGYGNYATNLFALANPDIYSHVVRPLAEPLSGFHEGFAFLGLGALLLVPMCAPAVLARPRLLALHKRARPLLVALVTLALFAVSNRVGVGLSSFRIPLPEALERSASVLRSSGRMFWPAFYAILLGAVVLLVRSHGARVSAWLLGFAVIVQAADTSEGWRKHYIHFRDTRAGAWRTPLQSDFWQRAGSVYRTLRHDPLEHHAPDCAIWADYAATHGMGTDSAYLARVDPELLRKAQRESQAAIDTGDFDQSTLYVLDRDRAAMAASTLDPDADLLTRVDGHYLLAPGWKALGHAAPTVEAELSTLDFERGVELGQTLFFGTDGDGTRYLGDGWSSPEVWGVWAEEPEAELRIVIDLRGPLPTHLELEAGALVADEHPSQAVDCIINGEAANALHFSPGSNTGWRQVAIPAPALAKAKSAAALTVTFRMQNPGVPKELGLNDDSRRLGIALHRLKLSRAGS